MHEEQRTIEKQLDALVTPLLRLGLNPADRLDNPLVEQFIETLGELVDFHKWHGEIRETVVGYLGLSAYIIVTECLNEMLHDNAQVAYHERIRELRDYIISLVQKIIAEGYAKSYYDAAHGNSGSADT